MASKQQVSKVRIANSPSSDTEANSGQQIKQKIKQTKSRLDVWSVFASHMNTAAGWGRKGMRRKRKDFFAIR